MFDLNGYLQKLLTECRIVFRDRLLYVGLQGSYMRGEAGENSDIDIMIVLDQFSVKDMDAYGKLLERIGYREKSCGFICGRNEITRWNPLEVCQLLHTTKDIYGHLTEYLPETSQEDEINYVKVSLGNLYHELCHRYIHSGRESSIVKFRGTCKSLFFLIQNMYYLETGEFVTTKKALKELVTEEDQKMLSMTDLANDFNFDTEFLSVFTWCQNAFSRIDQMEAKHFA